MESLIGKVVLLKQANNNRSFNNTDTTMPHWAYTEVLLMEVINQGEQARVRHSCGLDTYPDMNKIFIKPIFENI